MTRYRFNKIARAGLLDDLIAAGFTPTTPTGATRVETDDAGCWVTCDPADFDRVATVVAAHDAAASDAKEAQTQADDADNRTQARQAVAALVADYTRLEDGLQVLTVVQLRTMLARTNRALATTLRYLARRGL